VRTDQNAKTRNAQLAGGIMAEYTIGACKKCNKYGALKDGKCKDCQIEMPDFLRQIFHPEEK
jgi:hypothetical protein